MEVTALYSTRIWLKRLHQHGFIRKRCNGGHARFSNGRYHVDVPIHQKELSRIVIASIKRAIRASRMEQAA